MHVSQLADHFVKDPHAVVKVGERLKVRVLEVDRVRKRIALSARSGATPNVNRSAPRPRDPRPGRREEARPAAPAFANNPFAKLLKD